MRLNAYLKRLITLGLILILAIALPLPGAVTQARAEETAEVKLNVNSQAIVKGKTFSLCVYNLCEGQTVSFRSSAPEIASVDEVGIVTANAVGTATIAVTVSTDAETVAVLPCEITVGPPAISVQFSRLELNMVIGQKLTLERIIQPLNTVENAKFSSYDAKIASVSAGGRVTAKSEGSTYIFAQINNGRFAVCKVYVYADESLLPVEASEEADTDEELSEEALEERITDPVLKTTGVDFETFLKNLNAAGKNTESTDNGADETTN